MRIFALATLGALMLVQQPAQAMASEKDKIEEMDKDTWFKGTSNYPTKLSPALTPLLHCELRRAGSSVSMNGKRVEGPETQSECDGLRETAVVKVNETLDREGITSQEARARILKRSLGAVDALAASQRIWQEANR